MLKPGISFCILLIFVITAVYSQSDSVIISRITISGNKTTNSSVIMREIDFNEGDLIKKSDLNAHIQRAELNLLNLALFNFVTPEIYFKDSQNVEITFLLEERWYIWPYPILEHADRNINNYLKEKDWERINYGGYLEIENFRGRRENIILKARYGFKEQYSVTYRIPYIDKKKLHGVELTFSDFRQKIVPFNTIENRLIYLSDEDKYLKKHFIAGINYSLRPKIKSTHKLNLNYNRIFVEDTILNINPSYGFSGTNINDFYTISYGFAYDNQDLKNYPVKGFCFESQIQNYIYLSKNYYNFQRFSVQYSHHFNLADKYIYSVKAKISKTIGGAPSWIFSNALGYEEYLRGYEYYVIDGSDYYIFDQSLRFRLFPMQINTFNFIPLPKFRKIHYIAYAGIFFDSGYVKDIEQYSVFNQLSDKYIYSFGAGIDLVTYYDRMMRIEFSVNKLNQSGVYLHFEKYF